MIGVLPHSGSSSGQFLPTLTLGDLNNPLQMNFMLVLPKSLDKVVIDSSWVSPPGHIVNSTSKQMQIICQDMGCLEDR